MGGSLAVLDPLPPVSPTLWGLGDLLTPPGAWGTSWDMRSPYPVTALLPAAGQCSAELSSVPFLPHKVGGAHVSGVGLEKMLHTNPLPLELLRILSLSYIW